MFKYNQLATIKFSYNTTETELKININKNMKEKVDDFYTEDTALDGTRYKNYITTNEKRIWQIKYDYYTADVYEFFYNAAQAEKDGYDVVFSIEQDDGTFEDIDVLLNSFRGFNKTLTSFSREKVYKDLYLEIKQI